MIGGRSALLSAASGLGYGNWAGDYENVSLLLRNGAPALAPLDESPSPKVIATYGSNSIFSEVSKYGNSSLIFDGVSSYLSAPDVIELELGSSNLTLEMWVKTDSSVRRATLISRVPSLFAQGMWALYINETSSTAGNVALYVANYSLSSPLLLTSGVNVRDNEWHHIAVVRNGSAWSLYVDGISRAAQTWAGAISDIAGYLYIGREEIYFRYFSGYIDDLRITKGVARYTGNFTPPAAELPANITDDPNYNDVSLLLRGGSVQWLVPVDESPVPKDIEMVGRPSINTILFKYGDSALDFPGALGNHYSIFGLNNFTPGLGAWTVEAWIYRKSTGTWVIMSGDNFKINGDSTQTAVGDSLVNRILVSSVPALNTWVHVAVVRESNGTIRLFFNGIQQASSTGSLSTATTTGILIGARTAGATVGTDALLDDVRVTVGIARYTKNFLPPPAELPAI